MQSKILNLLRSGENLTDVNQVFGVPDSHVVNQQM